MMTGRVLLVCALCVLWCSVSAVNGDESDENVDFSSGRSEAPQGGSSEVMDGREGLDHKSCSVEPGSEGNTAECTKATTNDTDAISTNPSLPSHKSSDPNPQTGLQPPAPPTGAGQSHQTNPVQDAGVTRQVRQDVEEVKTKKGLEEQNKQKNKESHEKQSSREDASVIKGNQLVGQEAALQGDPAQQERKQLEVEPGQPQHETDVQHRGLSQHDHLLQGHEEVQEKRRRGEEQPQLPKAQKEKVPTASTTEPKSTPQSPPPVKPRGMQQEGSAASSSDPLKREIPSVLTKSKPNETIDPPLPQSSAGEGGAAAALGADEEDAKIRKDAEFPESAATEEDHQHKHSLKNDGEAKKEKTAFGTNNTAITNDSDSDSSTAGSHTSPLLLLLHVAAAAVVAGPA
ncbi:Mucin-associated surface protein (MASP) [Trypanosoma cruzi]|uniref:Mucin-associated surface protein (MASP), putative n=2 Tax=Trypanosoma cruzi TaxID=5693 RepID=Q4DVA5_TRYCC|nr:mucin-associated surface protein (MASP), putative [Trypanosoma cruzi]EAN96467.1 mucin-associated surface protein (MASP), putative [Trypanosoma cruzi]PWV15833.1 Mucin-associated surface protein (MASP) [Trypanosoma cruzi]|eukprot:XP_818318.1 mucin-associated surface protein (MASP) [Trypanosoma cruzi strain CL Brener]